MQEYKYVFGPIPSRRLGLSLGVSTIPEKYCNYSCIYCQLGRTRNLTNERKEFFPLNSIVSEFKKYIEDNNKFDVVTLVGEGEPTLYSRLGELIVELKKLTSKPVAVITNGASLCSNKVQEELLNADIVLPSIDVYDDESFRKIHRAYGKIKFQDTVEGLIQFSKKYNGQLWLEVMILDGINDDKESLLKIKNIIDKINYSRIYINTAVRPPAEAWVKPSSKEAIDRAVNILGGISIDTLNSNGFYSEIKDDYQAILSIIKRHPMNQHELKNFLNSRECSEDEVNNIFHKLTKDISVEVLEYKGYYTYRALVK